MTTMQRLKRTVKISDLINACVVLSQSSGPTVRRVLEGGSLNTMQKGDCKLDICTEADLRIQKTIQHNLAALFPHAKLICEEEESQINESMKPSMQPDQVLKVIRRQAVLTPEILSVS